MSTQPLYPAQFAAAEEGGYVVTFRDVPEAITQGDDFADALTMARDALDTALEFYDEAGKPRPAPGPFAHGDVAVLL